MDYTIHPIAYIRSDFTDKFGIPRQSGLVPELTARIVFAPEYRDPNALTGIEGGMTGSGSSGSSRPWRRNTPPAKLAAHRPPAASGRQRAARRLFATRSPYRPNALGLSCVELAGVENGDLIVRGADLLTVRRSLTSSPTCPMWMPTPMRAAGSRIRPERTPCR